MATERSNSSCVRLDGSVGLSLPEPPVLDWKTVQPLNAEETTSSVVSLRLNEVYVGSTDNTCVPYTRAKVLLVRRESSDVL